MEFNNVVSIIVPVYNSEKHLIDCVNSILNQSYKNIEVLLVNDGSTDNSGSICEDFAEKDCRVKAIHQKNSGPSVARNTGIKAARGDYIQFVDSDDYIESSMTKKLMEAMNENVQLVICGYKSINNNNVFTGGHIPSIEGVYQIYQFLQSFGELYKNNFINSPWNKLYVTHIIKHFNIRFIDNLNMGEDLLFNLDYIKNSNSICIIKDKLYNYLSNDNSLTESYKKDFFENQQMLFQKVREFLLEDKNYTENNKYYIESSYTEMIINCFGNLFHKKSNLNSKSRRNLIYNIVNDDCLRKKIVYFKNSSIQTRFIGLLIKYKSIIGIYCYFKIKKILKCYFRPLFNLLKLVNNKQFKRALV
ncbi:glycosyltransferase family 2 protein [Peribacillus butanolivorans]|uniref:glycosyltransferase family 2 protein n=1 Tax=Peribacillus butanolivorans TaxID=421767 RepID=UPI00366A58F8